MQLKEILDPIAQECGFEALSAYANSADPQDRVWIAIANREVATLSKHPWQQLRREVDIPITSAETYDLPADFRQLVPDTAWSKGQVREMDLPADDRMWAFLKGHTGTAGVKYRARITEGKLQVHNPNDGDVVRFEYISKYPVIDYQDALKERFTADNDSTILDDELLSLGVRWRFKKAKGLPDWKDDQAEYEKFKRSVMGTDGGSKTIDFVGTETGPPYDPYTSNYADTDISL